MQAHGHAVVAPGGSQFLRRDGDRREAGRGFGLQEAEAARHFVGADRAQAPVIDLNDETDAIRRGLRGRPHRNLGDNDSEFALEVDPVRLADERDVRASSQKSSLRLDT